MNSQGRVNSQGRENWMSNVARHAERAGEQILKCLVKYADMYVTQHNTSSNVTFLSFCFAMDWIYSHDMVCVNQNLHLLLYQSCIHVFNRGWYLPEWHNYFCFASAYNITYINIVLPFIYSFRLVFDDTMRSL